MAGDFMESDRFIVRRGSVEDLARMLEIYDTARTFMRKSGNDSQWVNGYPAVSLLQDDISAGVSYVIEADDRIVGTFAFIVGDDSTYSEIDGEWLNDAPYGTIHRIASDGSIRGIADACLKYCTSVINNIRIDTHKDNRPMLGWIRKAGFSYCGVIHVSDGTPREAFQLVVNS